MEEGTLAEESAVLVEMLLEDIRRGGGKGLGLLKVSESPVPRELQVQEG